jgi:hypothetical protein
MKKIILASVFIIASSLAGLAQNVEKALKNGKWYANAEFGSKTVLLTKNSLNKYVADVQLLNETALQYGKFAAADMANANGELVKAGTYYIETGYAYKVSGDVFLISFQPQEWSYKVTPLKNGDLSLELITSPTKSTK